MRDENCIFCKIISGEIPSRTLYEDEDFKAILDVAPAAKGHTLILPKQHCANLYEIEDELVAKAAKLAKKLGSNMKDKLNCDGLNLLQNNGELAGQTVYHFHMHLIPRYKDMKNQDILRWIPEQLTDEEQGQVQDLLRIE